MRLNCGNLLFLAVAVAALSWPAAADELADRVAKLTAEALPEVVACRRDLHAHPELSNREQRTAAKVAEQLRKIGVEDLKTGVARHGVTALIRGKRPGPTVALRADMDALPVLEDTGLPFASQTPGVMHACGHDAHTAILLGAARVLAQLRDEMPGSVKLIFQPAEEGAPAGEAAGAAQMVKEGVLENPPVAAIFGLHVNPELEIGQLGCRPGGIMAAVDHFHITVTGRQSHAAMPWQGNDPIVVAAQIITALQTIASRRNDVRQPIVVSVTVVKAGARWNILPGEVAMEGTIRTHDASVRQKALQWAAQIVEQTAAAHGAEGRFVNRGSNSVTWNDPALTERMRPSLVRAAGEANVVETLPMMGGEDFSVYARKTPGLFYFLGIRDKTKPMHSLHSPHLVVDERALPVGVRAMSLLALDYLRGAAAK